MQNAFEISEARNLIRAFARGDRIWTDLAELGLTVTYHNGISELHLPPGDRQVSLRDAVTLADVARGLVRHVAERPQSQFDLHTWAFILLGADVIRGDELEDHPAAETLREALWSASGGEPISDDIILLARQIAATG